MNETKVPLNDYGTRFPDTRSISLVLVSWYFMNSICVPVLYSFTFPLTFESDSLRSMDDTRIF